MFQRSFGIRFHIAKVIIGAIALAVTFRVAALSCAADSSSSLSVLESLLPASLTLAAAASRIEAADRILDRIKATSGMHYFSQSMLGPRSDVVSIAYGNNTVFRYAQRAGISLPLLGTRQRQQEEILAAKADTELRRIDLASQRRIVLASLRESYVQYWLFTQDETIAQRYFEMEKGVVASARALRKVGFWTDANLFAFYDRMDRVKTDIALSRQAAAVAFSKIRAFAGDQLAVFRPLEPDIGPACALDKDHVIASALTTDGEIRRLAIEIARRTASLNLVRWSSVDGAVQMGVGGYADAPRGVGYDLSVTVSLNLPMHHRVAEQSFEQSLRNEIQAFRDEEEQRRRELIADAEAALDNLERARQTLSHALVDAKATREALRVARIRFANLPMTGSAGFEEVETRTTENYVSERAELESRAQVYLLTNQLLLLAPAACGR